MERKDFFRPCIIIPAFNEEKGIENILLEIPGKIAFYTQVVVVDDCSSDRTAEIASNYMPKGVILFRHENNKGKGAALKTGISFALETGYDLIITMDGDGQHSHLDLEQLIKKAREGFDIVIGSRSYKKMPVTRRIANKLSSLVYKLRTGRKIKDTQSGFKAYLPEVLGNINPSHNGYMAEFEQLVRAAQHGYKIGEADIKTIYSADIKSKIRPLQQIYRFLKFNIVDSLQDARKYLKDIKKKRRGGKI